jgi:hypothetical protein
MYSTSHVPANYVGGIVPPALRASLHSLSAGVTSAMLGIIPLALRIPIGDNSIGKLQYTSFLKLGSHYFAKLVLSGCH